MNLTFDIEDEAWNSVPHLQHVVELAAHATLAEDREISLVFVSDEVIKEVNAKWRGKNYPTNVLSFPAAVMPLPPGEVAPLGDLIFAFGVVAKEAASQNKTIANHLSHLVVHGILHLLGYDHETEAEASAMENKERQILATLGIADPYLI